MSDVKNISVNDQDLGFNKKLENVKFDNVFDTVTIQNAEKLVERNKNNFLTAVVIDFNDLKKEFDAIAIGADHAAIETLQNKAFSIKSRATIGGFEVASNVAKSLFEFCENHIKILDATKHAIVKVHVHALEDIFTGKFDVNDSAKCEKLVSGLNQLVHKHAK